MNSASTRLVIDTAMLVAAYRSRKGASAALLELVLQKRVALVATPTLFPEYEAVLKRPEHTQVHGMSYRDIDRLLSLLALIAVEARPSYRWRPQLRDPADEHVLDAAVNGHASAIVTFNVRDFLPAATQFGIRVLEPGVILRSGGY